MSRFQRLLSVFLLPCAITTVARADPFIPKKNYDVRSWAREQGLPQGTVNEVLQARNGFLWLATYGGVALFDGQRFTTFNSSNTPAFRSNNILFIYEDSHKNIWFTDDTGTVYNFSHHIFERVRTYENRYFERIGQDETGEIWMVDRSRDLVRLSDNKIIPFKQTDLQHWTVPFLVEEKSTHRLWFSLDSALGSLNGDHVTDVGAPDHEPVRALGAANDGGLWIVTRTHLEHWSDGRWEDEITPTAQIEFSQVSAVRELRSGQVAVGSIENGVTLYNRDGTSENYGTAHRLPDIWVKSLSVDREGTLWIGLGNGGLAALQPVTFESVNPPDNWKGRPLTSVFLGQQGRLWIGTEGAGFYSLQSGVWTNYDINSGHGNRYIWSIDESSRGDLFLGTWGGGVYKRENTSYIRLPELADDYQRAPTFFTDHAGALWTGSQMGIFHEENGKHIQVITPAEFAHARVSSMVENNDRTIWFAFEGAGLASLKNGKLTLYHKSDGLPNEFVTALYQDSKNALWIGTQSGTLSRLKDGKFSNIGPAQGLSLDNIRAIADDGKGFFWLSTRSGIMRVENRALSDCADGKVATVAYRAFGTGDGLTSIETSGTGCRTDDGWLWFPTRRGLVRARPESIVQNPVQPPVMIEQLSTDGTPKFSDDETSQKIEIPPGARRFVFKYTALSFIAPERVHFKYRLKGIDADWIDAGTSRTAVYSFLPPGDYNFEVLAANSDDVWNPVPATLYISIAPFLWQTWWFRIGSYTIASVFLALAILYFAQRRWKQKLERMEQRSQLERERNRIAKDIHDDLGASLTKITLLTRSAQKNLPAHPERSAVHIEQIYTAAREVTRALDEIVWAVNPNHDSLDSVATYVAKFSQDFLGAAGISCRWDLPIELPSWTISSEVRHGLFLAYKEALNNIVRHARASRVTISLEPTKDGFVLAVCDDGIGLQESSASGRPTGGNGLVNMRLRLKEIGGRVEIKSGPDEGTCVSMIVLTKRAGQPTSI